MKKTEYKNIFKEGAISHEFIGTAIANHQTKTNIGAHSIFIGQVRADEIDDKIVSAIEYTAYEEMVNKKAYEVREQAFEKFDLTCMHIYHSLGSVKTGGICLFIMVSSKKRKEAIKAVEFLVEAIKSEVPVFGKELFEDDTHQWKINN